MPEITDDNIQKVKEQLQNLGQKAREAIGPEKAAAISASVPVVKSAARSAAIRSLRAMQTLCAAGAQKLEEGGRAQIRRIEAEDEPFSDEDSFVQESEPTPSLRESAPEPVRPVEPPLREVPEPQARAPRPAQRHASGEPEIIRPKSTTHARRTFTYFGVIVSLLAAGALVFSGVTLIRILRPRFGRPDAPRSIYEPVARANNSNAGIIRIQRSDPSSQKQRPEPAAMDKKPAAAAEQELPEKVKINYAGVNVRDDHSTQGTQVIGKAAKGDVKLLEFWEGKDQYPWYRIEAKNVTGWVYGRYVDVPPKPKAKNAPQLDGNERMGRVTRSGVNVRDDHSTKNTRVVGRRSNQDVVIIDEWKAEGASYPWYKIRLDNGEGWIYGKYVELK